MLSCIRLCVVGQPEGADTLAPLDADGKPDPGASKSSGKDEESFLMQSLKLGFCALGLQVPPPPPPPSFGLE